MAFQPRGALGRRSCFISLHLLSWASFSFLWSSLPLAAQQTPLRHYSLEDGLPQSQIHAVRQDRRGYIWVATAGGGLARFDGRTFETFNHGTPSLIHAICEDRNGTLWFGSNKGLSRYDGRAFAELTAPQGLANVQALLQDRLGRLWVGSGQGLLRFDGTTFSTLGADLLLGASVLSIAQDKQDRLWIGTEDRGLFIYEGKRLRSVDGRVVPVDQPIWDLTVDAAGNVWIGTGDGMIRFDGQFRKYTLADGLPGRQVFAIAEDHSGQLWLGTDFGVARYDGRRFAAFAPAQIGVQIRSVYEDREHNLWFGTEGAGLFVYSRSPFTHYRIADGLIDGIVWSIAEDDDGALWFGTTGSGLSRFDGDRFTTVAHEGLPGEATRALLVAGGELWIGSDRGVSRYDGRRFAKAGSPFDIQGVRALAEDRAEGIWVSTFREGLFRLGAGGWRHFTKRDGLSSEKVFSMLGDRAGNLWIGTSRGLSRYDGQRFSQVEGVGEIGSEWIVDIVEDRESGLWLATYGGGIKFVGLAADGSLESVDSLDVSNGLADNAVPALVLDDAGSLWACTNKGLSRIDLSAYRSGERRIRNYGRQEGFTGIECAGASFKSRDGTLWFGTIDDITRYDPALDLPNTVEPPIYITGMKLFLEQTDWTAFSHHLTRWTQLPAELRLPHNKNHLSFEFAALSFSTPQKVRYMYKLDGLDTRWSPVSAERHATYSNLPPGEYTFLVRAANNDGVWSAAPASFSFVIAPAFWQTSWFFALGLVAAGGCVLGIVRLRTRTLRLQRLRLERTVEQRTRDLRRSNTQLKVSEECLRQLQRDNELILNSVAEGLCGIDRNGRVVFVNPAFCRLTGYDSSEILRKPLVPLLDCARGTSTQPTALETRLHSVLQDGEAIFAHREEEFSREDRTRFPVEYALTPITEKEDVVGAVLTFRDVTEKRQLQAQLLQSQKLEAIGQLASGIAHEINTPIQFVSDNTRFLQNAFEDVLDLMSTLRELTKSEDLKLAETVRSAMGAADADFLAEEVPEAIEQSRNGLDRVASIVRALKEFAHPGGHRDPVDLNRAIENAMTVSRGEWKFFAEIETDLQDDLPLVPCQPNEIKQVFLNIIVNAAHAVAETVGDGNGHTKGTITVRTRRDDAFVEIGIADTGKGIPQDIRDRIFDPFFTTKAVGKGTGQGLAIVHNIVSSHGGTISVESREGEGSVFTIRLPLRPDEPSSENPSAILKETA